MRHPRLTAAAAVMLSLAVAAGLLELALRVVAPTAVVTAGWATSANGKRYGWGFDGGERQAVRDADSGRLYLNRANPRGWRDLPRSFDKPDGVFRVLVLGDSNVFGYLVPEDKTATRQLEDRLKAAGVNAEVINISSSGWGTDQEVEALRLEGLRYRPDLVVIHFCINDLHDNLLWQFGGKFAARRPFYYREGADGAAERVANPGHKVPLATRLSEFALRHLELAKVAHNGWQTLRALRKSRYEVTAGQVANIRLDFGDRAPPAFLAELSSLIGRDDVTEAELTALFARHGLDGERELLLRLCERLNGMGDDHVDAIYRVDVLRYPAEHWAAFTALVRTAKRLTDAAGAKLALSTDIDQAHWQWELDWHHVERSEAARRRFLTPNDKLRAIAAELGIGFVEPTHPAARARNDAHPTAEGNAAIAANLFEYMTAQGLVLTGR